jgi:pyruvate/2-oxoglutarate dehydrogenase complex dihydrolipoamide dehydrogenase (E3) component
MVGASDDMALLEPDICIIGAGSAGLSVAAGAARLGAETVLIEAGAMGGDCLNVGCVPSKSLIAAAAHAHAMRSAGPFGIEPVRPVVHMGRVRRHIDEVIAGIAPHDSALRFEGLGVRVIRAHGRFGDARTVEAGGSTIRARRFVVATGSRPAIPPIPGLDTVPFLTNETIFANETLPEHLLVLGGGPIGVELAQAYRRLGARVTVLDIGPLLPRDDPELTAVVREALLGEGVELVERAAIRRVEAGPVVVVGTEGSEQRIAGSHLLVATGRQPAVDELGLDAAGIAHDTHGITVDRGLRTTNRRVYAIGDVAGGPQFTHVAGYHASLVIKSALFRLPARVSDRAIPHVTYTDPALAQVGLDAATAEQRGIAHEVVRWPFALNDRARTARATAGLIKVVASPRGRVLGAGIAGAGAGELILPWVLATERRLKLSTMASLVVPYPTLGEAGKSAAGAFFTERLFGERTRKLVAFLRWFG